MVGTTLEITPSDEGFILVGEVDAHTAPQLKEAVAGREASVVVLDISGVTFMDSSGLRVVITATRDARSLRQRPGPRPSICSRGPASRDQRADGAPHVALSEMNDGRKVLVLGERCWGTEAACEPGSDLHFVQHVTRRPPIQSPTRSPIR
ncbi:MAG: STAS domain-containing protein [Ilumatobacteraceae bacterium]